MQYFTYTTSSSIFTTRLSHLGFYSNSHLASDTFSTKVGSCSIRSAYGYRTKTHFCHGLFYTNGRTTWQQEGLCHLANIASWTRHKGLSTSFRLISLCSFHESGCVRFVSALRTFTAVPHETKTYFIHWKARDTLALTSDAISFPSSRPIRDESAMDSYRRTRHAAYGYSPVTTYFH